jgi:hypothetical protein
MYELASVALDFLFDQAGEWALSIADKHTRGGSAPTLKSPKLTIRNRTSHTVSMALCVGWPKTARMPGGVSCHAAGWYNLPSGGVYTEHIAIAGAGMHVVVYAEAPGTDLEWSGDTPMYATRPDSFYITNALTRDACLTRGNGRLEVINGNSFVMNKDQVYNLTPPIT